jgi:hypothetical protein
MTTDSPRTTHVPPQPTHSAYGLARPSRFLAHGGASASRRRNRFSGRAHVSPLSERETAIPKSTAPNSHVMNDAVDRDLYERTKALLEPGDIDLLGCVVHTDLSGQEDLEMHELTVALNEVISARAEKGETYIYAGNDNTDFASNQFQGLTLDDEAFVWECQQLLREGTFDLVFYYEADVDQDALVADIEALDHVDRVTPVP